MGRGGPNIEPKILIGRSTLLEGGVTLPSTYEDVETVRAGAEGRRTTGWPREVSGRDTDALDDVLPEVLLVKFRNRSELYPTNVPVDRRPTA